MAAIMSVTNYGDVGAAVPNQGSSSLLKALDYLETMDFVYRDENY